jgi:hypothetical protein
MSHVKGYDSGGVGYGVWGESINNTGVFGSSNWGNGVFGFSPTSTGVWGRSYSAIGVRGVSDSYFGVYGYSSDDIGVCGHSVNSVGVAGFSPTKTGVRGSSYSAAGVHGDSANSVGVAGFSPTSNGVWGRSYSAAGVYGLSDTYFGVYGQSYSSTGVYGYSSNGIGVYGESTDYVGVYGRSDDYIAIYGRSKNGHAAWLDGNVKINGSLDKAGGSFKIDHPLDPANRYLSHSFVESPDMKNIYDGTVALDKNGEAVIQLPDWFDALNKDFRYQLTAIGAPGPNLYIAKEISDDCTNHSNNSSKNNGNSRFKIAGGNSGMKVSWQVTGIRRDPWANANRIQVEEDKPAKERGYYMYPDLYGQPKEKSINRMHFPEEKWLEQLEYKKKQSRRFR